MRRLDFARSALMRDISSCASGSETQLDSWINAALAVGRTTMFVPMLQTRVNGAIKH